jgi:hypothetical protein
LTQVNIKPGQLGGPNARWQAWVKLVVLRRTCLTTAAQAFAQSCVYRKPHPALIFVLAGEILYSCARISCTAEIIFYFVD